MGNSPGHAKWPEHKVREEDAGQRLQVAIDGQIVADSSDVIKVSEDEHPDRYYFVRQGVEIDRLQRSSKTTECPFKGTAQHFSLKIEGGTLQDVAWSYEDPFDEHAALKGRIAFYDERPEIDVRPAG